MTFVDRLAAALATRSPVRVHRPEARNAAVAVVIAAETEPSIVFIKRKERVGDPWSGQMAFPGGFAAPGDGSLLTTARRETEEETGIVLEEGDLLGVLDDVSPRTPYLPPLVVTPYVFRVPGRLPASPGPEAEATVWLEVRDLFDPSRRRPFRLTLPRETREFDSIVIGGYTIWGLTERVLDQMRRTAA
ncbi:MAG TPA: CoA pyrophosphatase [Gemmatimonadales bacterium]|nr:CoA pyrophosphatase [Gemmatimonadales bacterium]